MMHMTLPHRRLHRALAASAACHGLTFHPLGLHERPWSSATFTGERLTIDLAIAGGDAAAGGGALPRGGRAGPAPIVADLIVTRRRGDRATLEVLLLEQ